MVRNVLPSFLFGPRLTALFQAPVLGGVCWYVVVFVVLAILRIQYPFELQGSEGAFVDHIARVAKGEQVYVSPSVDWVPQSYPPLYYYIASLPAQVIGMGFVAPRLVSILSTIGSLVLIFLLVRRETGRLYPGLVAAGLYAASFEVIGGYFDLSRLDAFLILLLLGSLYAARGLPGIWAPLVAGLVSVLALFTKQQALLPGVAIALFYLMTNQRYFLVFSGSYLGLGIISFAAIEISSHGWFSFYAVLMPMSYRPIWSNLVYFWTRDILSHYSLAMIACLSLFLRSDLWQRSERGRFLRFYFLVLMAALAASWLSRLNVGGKANVLMPAVALISVCMGLAVHDLMKESKLGQSTLRWQALVALGLLVQFAVLLYQPRTMIPESVQIAAGQRFIDTIRSFDGEVLVAHHGYYSSLAGKSSYSYVIPVLDVLGHYRRPSVSARLEDASRLLEDSVNSALKEKRFAAIVVDNDYDWFPAALREHYRLSERLFDDPREFRPIQGGSSPSFLYVPK